MPTSTAPTSHLNDSVTQHMRTDLARVRVDQTVGQAIAASRAGPPEGRIIYFYAVDDQGRLEGVVPTRRLLLSDDATPIRDIMVQKVITIPASASVLEACEFFLLHRLLAFPILDEERRLLGIVDVDLYTDELADLDRREDTDDLFQLIGVHFQESQQGSSLAAFRSRFPWLITNIAGGIVAAFLSGFFQAELEQAVSLALFIPVVLALAESVSIQSVSLSLQMLHNRQPTLAGLTRSLRVESLTGILLGSASAAAVALVAYLWLGDAMLVACLLGGIAGGVACAALIGVAMPNVLRLFNREPQVAAGPVALAATDMLTLTIYFSLARWLMS
ncbi:MAG: CBS domain-containing protein [Planctomycetota bacterium]|jgi:magnesium transporter|nr:CBS domain-containing protein [Planctomycetota bacterium]